MGVVFCAQYVLSKELTLVCGTCLLVDFATYFGFLLTWQRPPIARCLAVEAHYTSLFHPISLLRREVEIAAACCHELLPHCNQSMD